MATNKKHPASCVSASRGKKRAIRNSRNANLTVNVGKNQKGLTMYHADGTVFDWEKDLFKQIKKTKLDIIQHSVYCWCPWCGIRSINMPLNRTCPDCGKKEMIAFYSAPTIQNMLTLKIK